jgi:predicted MFS family arabinose efflux permease
MGVALDRHGPRRTVVGAFAFAVLGGVVSAAAPGFTVLVVGQLLVGVGCAPALLATMVFITRRCPAGQFSRLSGLVLGLGGLGMLITATPLAWVVERWSWRAGFLALAGVAAIAWLAVLVLVDDEPPATRQGAETLGDAARQVGALLTQDHMAGILCLAAVSYAAFITLRGLWLGPLLLERHGFSLMEVGHVAFALSLISLLGPIVFGQVDPGGRARRAIIILCALAFAGLFGVLAIGAPGEIEVALAIFTGFLSGFILLQYAELRAAYPAEMMGRALAVFTMAMFLGVAAMQWLSGLAASVAAAHGADPLWAAFSTVAFLLAAGAAGYWLLPWPDELHENRISAR